MTPDQVDCVALVIFGSLAEGGWSKDSWRECVPEVEAAWWALSEWRRDEYRHAAWEAMAVAVAVNPKAMGGV